MSLFASLAAIVVLLLTSDRKSFRYVSSITKVVVQNDRQTDTHTHYNIIYTHIREVNIA